MATDPADLGSHLGTYRPSGGFTGFQNRPPVRTALLTVAGLFVGLIPGLFVALIADLWPALIVGPLLGAVAAFLWARRVNFEAAVTEARFHERGVVFVDARGTHALTWDRIASIEGKHVQNIARTPVGDVKGVTTHTYTLRTLDGTGFWLDDRVDNVAGLAEAVARASGVTVTPMV